VPQWGLALRTIGNVGGGGRLKRAGSLDGGLFVAGPATRITLKRISVADHPPGGNPAMTRAPLVTVVIPANNEEAIIAITLERGGGLPPYHRGALPLGAHCCRRRSQDHTGELIDRFAAADPG